MKAKSMAVLLLVLLLTVSGFTPPGNEEIALKIALPNTEAALIPLDAHNGVIEDLIFDSLPDMSTWSADGLVYEFELLPNIRWHDGKTLTAADVAFTLGLAQQLDRSFHHAKLADVADVEIEDSSHLTIRLKADIDLISALASIPILPAHLLNTPSSLETLVTFGDNPVGTGPYRFVSRTFAPETGEDVWILEGNSSHYGDAPVDRLTLVMFPTAEYRLGLLYNYALDFHAAAVWPDLARVIEESEGVTVAALPETYYYALLVRDQTEGDSIAYLVDRQEILTGIFNDYGSLPEGKTYSPNYFKKLMETNGWALDGVWQRDGEPASLTLVYPEVFLDDHRRIAAYLQASFTEAGMDVAVEARDWDALLPQQDWDIALTLIATDEGHWLYLDQAGVLAEYNCPECAVIPLVQPDLVYGIKDDAPVEVMEFIETYRYGIQGSF